MAITQVDGPSVEPTWESIFAQHRTKVQLYTQCGQGRVPRIPAWVDLRPHVIDRPARRGARAGPTVV